MVITECLVEVKGSLCVAYFWSQTIWRCYNASPWTVLLRNCLPTKSHTYLLLPEAASWKVPEESSLHGFWCLWLW